MSDAEPTYPRRWGCFRTLLWLMLLIVVVAISAPIAFHAGDRYGFERGHSVGFREGFDENEEARTLERHAGVNLALGTDTEMVLDGLDDFTPAAVPEAYDQAVNVLVRDLLRQTARAYAFETGHDRRAEEAWSEMRTRVASGQYQQLRTWHNRRTPIPGQRLSLDHHAVATDFRTIMADEACALVRELWTVSAGPDQGRPVLPGLCLVVDRELLAPWMADLLEAALARDVATSVTESETRARRTIMELATAELRIDATVRHDYESKLFEGWVFESRDVATLEVSGTGIVKSGFKLHERYTVSVDSESRVIKVTLPRAQVLSNTLVPIFQQEKEGWWTSLSSKQRNTAITALQKRVENQALEDGILQMAEERAEALVQDLYSPITALPGSPYTVEVAFEGNRE